MFSLSHFSSQISIKKAQCQEWIRAKRELHPVQSVVRAALPPDSCDSSGWKVLKASVSENTVYTLCKSLIRRIMVQTLMILEHSYIFCGRKQLYLEN